MGRVRTIEATGKGWKALRGLGCLGMITGMILVGAGMAAAHEGSRRGDAMLAAVGMLCVLGGLSVWLVGRLGGWWFHG